MQAEVMSNVFYDLFARTAELERAVTGFVFTEGPAWDKVDESLVFSDIKGNTIYRFKESGRLSVVRRPSGMSNGLTFDHEQRLVTCEHAGRRLSLYSLNERTGPIVTLADRYDGKRLNSPNDVIVGSDKSIYFTDPNYGLVMELRAPEEQELPFQGVYRLAPGGNLTLLVDDFAGPNGLTLSPDERKLFINDTERQHIRVFDFDGEGRLINGRVFAELDESKGAGVADGLKVDAAGNVYCIGPAGLWIFDPEGNEVGLLRVPEIASNLTWGGSDGRVLYITATTSVYRIPVGIKRA
ncbi:SMP-30/gluconolactonase/LRE family protein [Paenibacillus sp. sptzw28]|uniref:SMP-30/gluconolactonase/LRE family protein n=1 Tax=Paenibacillus sp. sptzw28 TaxID=715179 RepID=UPI001C6E0859|nr:SMP-30/gluconolactonase/LRE family protein [Paenibacillus sp. sptzw28]QYR21795.1 SMP-30/gluconolactonase/LRE family protein [Paenibacillus sp. sptzw28]